MNMEKKEKLLDYAPDSLAETFNLADSDNWPNIGKLFEIPSVCQYLD